ncbi:MAG: acylphosphatase, partial [Burkholderiales bacterium]
FYRDSMRSEAQRHGVTGWVRNRRDGSVEAIVQGEAGAVEALIAWARRGPPSARVTEVSAQPAPPEHDRPHTGFDLLPTA